MQHPETLGRSLTALATSGTLELISKAKGCLETHSFTFCRGVLQRRGLAAQQRLKSGTTVTVRQVQSQACTDGPSIV